MNSTSVLNAAWRSSAGETGRELRHPEAWPAFPDLSSEHHNLDFARSADDGDAAPPGIRFSQRGVPFSPLHDV